MAFPGIMLAVYCAVRRLPFWTALFGLAGTIGLTSVCNTFMHIRTPLYLGFWAALTPRKMPISSMKPVEDRGAAVIMAPAMEMATAMARMAMDRGRILRSPAFWSSF